MRRDNAADRIPPTGAGLLSAASGAAARRQQPHRGKLPRRVPIALRFRRAAHRKTSLCAAPGRPRRAAGARLPRTPRERPRQLCPDPQRPAGRDPLIHEIRGPPRPGLAADHRSGAGDPRQTVRPARPRLSHPRTGAAILAAPNRATWSGHRDAVLFTTAYNTGARVSELTGLKVRDVLLDRETAVHLHGKGRKQRAIPLWKNTATELRGWLNRISPAPDAAVFPNRAGAPLTRSGVQDRLNRAVATAEHHCPSLHGRHISPHTLRHSTAMHLLQSGTDLAVIALWLGHSSPAVTHQYLEADLTAKEA